MSHCKISVVVLGSEAHLKKALITVILGQDLSLQSKRKDLKNTEIYENDTYVVTCTPDLYTACEDIKKVYAINRHPDISLLVVGDGISIREVHLQIEKLYSITGRSTEEFRVVLPLSYKHPASYPFRYYTIKQVFSELSRLAEGRHLMPTNTSYADHPESDMSTPHTPMAITGKHSGTNVNLVLVGKAGTGKSASGNTILRKTVFMSTTSSNPVTTECQEAETEIGGRHVRVIDTPDIFDDEIKSSIKSKHVRKCKQLCQPGPCVFLLVMRVSRFTEDERDILKKLETAFGSKVQEQTVILFTRGEDLWRARMNFEGFLHDCQSDLKKIVARCGSRCVLFENNASGSHQVEELMKTVDRMLQQR